MSSPYLSVGEVALFMGKSEKWVYNRIHEIPGSFKIGGSWFIDKEILVSSLKDLASNPTGKGGGPYSGNEDPHRLL